jgi:hypothetical protein
MLVHRVNHPVADSPEQEQGRDEAKREPQIFAVRELEHSELGAGGPGGWIGRCHEYFADYPMCFAETTAKIAAQQVAGQPGSAVT